MPRLKFSAVLLLLVATSRDAFAAMSDSAAMAKAQALWGAKGLILQCRFPTDTYWTKQVGYFDGTKIVILGSAANTWDAAFAAVQATGTFSVCGAAPAVPAANVTIQPFYQELLVTMPFDFIVQRDGATDADLTVSYFLGNSARPGVDYIPDPGGGWPGVHTLTIPKGSASTTMHFQSVEGTGCCRPNFVTVQLLPGHYVLAANNSANAGFFTKEMRPGLVTTLPPPAPNQVPIGQMMVLPIPRRNR